MKEPFKLDLKNNAHLNKPRFMVKVRGKGSGLRIRVSIKIWLAV